MALLGPNGAGKTTTIKMCATMLAPTSGDVRVDGVDAIMRPREARGRIGIVLGGDGGFYGRSSARNNLLFFADVAGVPGKQRIQAVDDALRTVGLSSRADTRVREYSRGMTQRLHLARGLLGSPRLLLLDEPTNGLDPEYAADVRATIRDISTTGAGVLLTTHLLAEAEALSDHVVVIDRGRVLVEGTARGIGDASGIAQVSTVSLSEASPLPQEIRAVWEGTAMSIAETKVFGRSNLRLEWSSREDEARFSAWLPATASADDAVDLHSRGPTLEESYLALTTSHDLDRK